MPSERNRGAQGRAQIYSVSKKRHGRSTRTESEGQEVAEGSSGRCTYLGKHYVFPTKSEVVPTRIVDGSFPRIVYNIKNNVN